MDNHYFETAKRQLEFLVSKETDLETKKPLRQAIIDLQLGIELQRRELDDLDGLDPDEPDPFQDR
jgi:hypothetical protein